VQVGVLAGPTCSNTALPLSRPRRGQRRYLSFLSSRDVDLGADDEGDPIGSCVVVPVEGERLPGKRPHLSGAAKVAFEQLCEIIADAGEPAPASTRIAANVPVVPISLWRDAFYKAYPEADGTNGTKRDTLMACELASARKCLCGSKVLRGTVSQYKRLKYL
jgi:hypothetical protein